MSSYDFVGVDVSKDKFDVALAVNNRNKQAVFVNNEKGYKEFMAWLRQHTTQPWVCMEATGHYSEELANFLISKAIRVSVVNPYQIKNYARASLC